MRKACLVLFLLCFFPCYAFSQQLFELSCNAIHEINISTHDDQETISIQLTPKHARHLYEITTQHLGERLAIAAGRQILTCPTIYSPIKSGRISFMPPDGEGADDIAKLLCPTKVQVSSSLKTKGLHGVADHIVIPQEQKAPVFTLSCDNVAGMGIWKMANSAMGLERAEGFVYALQIDLVESAGAELIHLLDAASPMYLIVNGQVRQKDYAQRVANGERLPSYAPTWDSFSQNGLALALPSRSLALDMAHKICPSKVPAQIHGEKDPAH